MKTISVKSKINDNKAGFYPIVLFGNNLLQSGYDVINDILFQGGSVSLNKTHKTIETFDSVDMEDVVVADDMKTTGLDRFINVEKEQIVIEGVTHDLVTDVTQTGNAAYYLQFNPKAPNIRTPMVRDVNTNLESVLTDVTASGGGGSAYSDKVEYSFNGSDVEIFGNGYKKLLSDTSNAPLFIEGLRLSINGASNNEVMDILSSECFLIRANGTEIKKNPFEPINFIRPTAKKFNIVEIPLQLEIDGNTSIVINSLINSSIEIKTTLFYK